MTSTSAISSESPLAVFDLPLITQSQNAYQRSHWLERHKLVERYRRLIGQQLSELLGHDPEAIRLWPPLPHKRAEVTCVCTAQGCDGRPSMKDERGQSWCGLHDLSRLPPAQRRIVFTRYSAGELDYGNLVGGAKPLVDALVKEGVLYDDKPRWLDEDYRQQPTPKGRGRIVIEVYPCS